MPHTKSQKIWTTFFILIGVTITANMVGVFTSLLSEHREKQLADERKAFLQADSKKFVLGRNFFLCRTAIWDALVNFDHHVREIFDSVTGYVEIKIDMLERRLTGEFSLSDVDSPAKSSGGFFGFFSPRPIGTRQSANAQYDTSVVTANTRKAINDLRKMKQDLLRSSQDMKYQTFHDFIYVWVLVLTGTFAMQVIEDWKLNDAYYWSVVTITTVGYGDVVPTSKGGKVFAIFYILIGTGLMAKTLGNIIMVSIPIMV